MANSIAARQRRFIQCDVFTSNPTRGNALAVVVDGHGLSDDTMQTFAAWTNLAETTFLSEPTVPEADYAVRIFTTSREMPFAGHPTLGSCASWLHAGGKPKETSVVRQQCNIGVVEIDISGEFPAFIAPPTDVKAMPPERFAAITDKLKISPDDVLRYAVLNNGPQWHVFELSSAEKVLALDSSLVRYPEEVSIGLIGRHTEAHECDFEVRMLAPSSGMSEDPITGSLNAALAHWRLHNQELDSPVVIAQGTSINREGRVFVTPNHAIKGQVLIGGQTHIMIDGSVFL